MATKTSSKKSSSNQKQVNAIVKAVGSTKGKSTADQVSAITNAYKSTGGSSASGSSRLSQEQYDYAAGKGASSLNSINSNLLKDSSLIDIPKPTIGPNEMSTIVGANAAVVNPAFGITTGENGTLQVGTPQAGTATDTFNAFMEQYKSNFDSMGTEEARYKKLEKELGIQKKQQEVQNYTSQINNITAKAQAESLGLEGQGRGITESIIGGQQAQISREAAIQALPLQALLANAQGNLELAQNLLETRFKIQSQDAQNKFNYDMKVLDSIKGFLDKKEERAWQEIQQEKQNAFELKKSNIAFERQKYMENLGFANSKALKQFDMDNREVATTQTNPLGQAQAKGNIDLISGLASDKYLNTAVGPNPLARISFTDAFTGGKSNFISGVEQLTSQLSLDSLIRAKQNGATFGALSEGELKVLNNSATKLSSWAQKDKNGNVTGYKTNQKDFKTELDKINNFAKLDYLIKGGNLEDVGAVKTPDGKIAVKNSDGTYTLLN